MNKLIFFVTIALFTTNSFAAKIEYLVSDKSSLKFCNGADMDSDGYRKTITVKKTAEVKETGVIPHLKLATIGPCPDFLVPQLKIKIKNKIATLSGIDSWAGSSIAMCGCTPAIEVNLMKYFKVKKVVWKEAKNR